METTARTWGKPSEGWVKVNLDAALFEDIYCIVLGNVVRHAAGKFLMDKSSKHEGLVPPREAEALGLKEALSWLKGRNCSKCIF